MGKKKHPEICELSEMMGKNSLGGNGERDKSELDDLNNESEKKKVNDVNEILMRVIDATAGKVEDIADTWKDLIGDPLHCDIQSIQDCLTNPELLKNALLSTFSHVKEIQEILDVEKSNAIERNTKADPTNEKKEENFINTAIFSSDSENENVVAAEAQCDLSDEEVDDEKETGEPCVYRSYVGYSTVKYSNASENGAECLTNVADESVYEDCEEEVQPENMDGTNNEDVTYDGDDSSSESSDTESEEDPSWMVSDPESSGSEYEENKRPTVKEMPKVNFATANTKSMGLWLSDNGPVHLNTMCHCKGMCVKNCACRTAGIMCSVRCGCKTDKCKWRRAQETGEDIYDDGDYKERLRAFAYDEDYKEKLKVTKAMPNECDTNKPEKKLPSPVKSDQQSMEATKTVLKERDTNKPEPTLVSPVKSTQHSIDHTVFCTPAPLPKPAKKPLEETPGNDVFMTPACRPPTYSTDSSLLTSTAKKRNKKKLFTNTVGPQEL